MNHEDEIDRLLREKSFPMLTAAEREIVLRVFDSEEEYEAVRKIELSMHSGVHKSTLEPRPETMRALKLRMSQPEFDWRFIFQIKVPAYAAVAAILFSSLFVYFVSTGERKVHAPNTPVTEIATVHSLDTVYITKVDTVVRERIVYRSLNMVSTPKLTNAEVLVPVKQSVGSGVNMKEKEELNKLSVSGSD